MAGTVLLTVLPAIQVITKGRCSWISFIPGALVLAVFFVIFVIEMRQDNGKVKHYEKHLREAIPYNPDKDIPIMKSSICTGEKVAGFRDRETGHFTEVMVIRNEAEKKRFMSTYGIEHMDTEY